jgi:DNA replication protein DnaC
MRKLSLSSEQAPKPECEVCNDAPTGMVIVRENGYSFAKPCVCRLEKLRRNRLAQIPQIYKDVSIDTLKAINNSQQKAVALVKAYPQDNFIFCGRFGSGKTYLLWTLYKAAVMRDTERVVACKMVTLIDEYKRFIADSMANVDKPVYPRIAAADLRQDHTKYSIFFDDIDKETPTEFVAKQVFDLADAIYENKHQIVTTTNLTVTELVDYFDRADKRYGGGIVRRLIDNAHRIEMF